MAAVASGAREALIMPDRTPAQRGSVMDSPASARSPRCEAFVMTGDKILSLDHHVSPSYAKVAAERLPPSTKVCDTPSRSSAIVSFPSMRRSRLPVSLSQPEGIKKQAGTQGRMTAKLEEVSPGTSESIELPSPSELSEEVDTRQKSDRNINDVGGAETMAMNGGIMESSMNSSYYKSAFSNPQLSTTKRTTSNETFVIQSGTESVARQSTVTVHAVGPMVPIVSKSVSAANSPSFRRVLGVKNTSSCVSEDMLSLTSVPGEKAEEMEARRMAGRLFRLNGCDRSQVADMLNQQSELAALVTVKYLELFSFSGLRIDAALREFLGRVELRGESSQRERLLQFFSARYHECNATLFQTVEPVFIKLYKDSHFLARTVKQQRVYKYESPSVGIAVGQALTSTMNTRSDDVHTLTCALLLLNSDLHAPNIGKRMAVRDFVNNIGHTGQEYKRDLLKTLYTSIKDQPIVSEGSQKSSKSSTFPRKPFTYDPMRMEVDPESQVEYKSGWLVRKCVYDSDGARNVSSSAPYGRRGWTMWYARLKGLVLYLERDEGQHKKSRYETFSNAILLHHAFAEPAKDYDKKHFVFRLRTADLGEFLFQTSSSIEVDDWVEQINFVCAAFSSRALPPSASKGNEFHRVKLPRMPSQAPLSQQLQNHEVAAGELHLCLKAVRDAAPPLKTRGRLVEQFFFRERYLTQEIARYQTYCQLLSARLGDPRGSDSSSGIHSKSDMADDTDRISYREAMHH